MPHSRPYRPNPRKKGNHGKESPKTEQREDKEVKLTPEQRAENRVKHLKLKLDLSEKQIRQIKPIYVEYYSEKVTGKSHPKHNEQMQELNRKIERFLTDEQIAKFRKDNKDKKEGVKSENGSEKDKGAKQDGTGKDKKDKDKGTGKGHGQAKGHGKK